MLRVAALAYRVVASTLFAQISLFFIVESAFYSFVAPAFRAFKFFSHTLNLHCISDFSNAVVKNFAFLRREKLSAHPRLKHALMIA